MIIVKIDNIGDYDIGVIKLNDNWLTLVFITFEWHLR